MLVTLKVVLTAWQSVAGGEVWPKGKGGSPGLSPGRVNLQGCEGVGGGREVGLARGEGARGGDRAWDKARERV